MTAGGGAVRRVSVSLGVLAVLLALCGRLSPAEITAPALGECRPAREGLARGAARNPTTNPRVVMPAQAGIQAGRGADARMEWIPASAGMTGAESARLAKNIDPHGIPSKPGITLAAPACASRKRLQRWVCPTAGLSLRRPFARARETVTPRKKKAWERALGGEDAAKPHIQARLAGWPKRVLADKQTLPAGNGEFALRVARDAWKALDALTDRENGLPIDHVRFTKTSTAITDARIGDYASGTNIGLNLIDVAAAEELHFVSRSEAIDKIRRVLDTLQHLETYRGLFFNYYDTTSLERTSNFLSFVDSSWLAAGLMVVRMTFPELHAPCTRLITQMDFRSFYDPATGQVSHGFYVNPLARSPYDYGMLYTEARLGSFIAIGKGDIPEEHWFAMARTLPADCAGQTQTPKGIRIETVHGYEFPAGYYEWDGRRYVPSWGGSMFEALMPTLVLDEVQHAPKNLGANDQAHALVQQRYALDELGYPVWGISPSASPVGDKYAEYGVKVLGARGYAAGAVTPHASALALSVTPEAALANLHALAERYDIYGEYGFYDAVEPLSGAVAYTYLSLDQSMLFIAMANYLGDHCVQKRFASDPIAQKALPIIAPEAFFE
jgi:hypothetical protein